MENAHAWENCKENVLPSRRGRAISKIVKLTKPTSKSRREEKLDEERNVFETQLKSENVENHPDPILLWSRYVKWIEANYPKGDLIQYLAPILERCTQSLMETDRYAEDKRFLRIWIRYADIEKDREQEIFNFLDNKNYFSTLSLFYIARAVVAEKNGNVHLADETYRLGINRSAQPLDKLKSRKRHFERRMARRWLEKKKKEEEEDDGGDGGQDRPHEESRNNQRRRHKLQTVSSRPRGLQARERSTQAEPAKEGNGENAFAIFSDDVVTAPSGVDSRPAVPGWDRIGSNKSARKENTQKAGKWAGATLPDGDDESDSNYVRHRRRRRLEASRSGAVDSGFVIHADPINESNRTTGDRDISSKTMSLRERAPVDGESIAPYEDKKKKKKKKNKTSRTEKRDVDRTKMKKKKVSNETLWAFDRKKVGQGVKEMSFEELRAARYETFRVTTTVVSPPKDDEMTRELRAPPTVRQCLSFSAANETISFLDDRVVSTTAAAEEAKCINGSTTTNVVNTSNAAAGFAAETKATRYDSDDVTINTRNVLRDLQSAFEDPSVSWNDDDDNNGDRPSKEDGAEGVGTTFAIFADDGVRAPSSSSQNKAPFTIHCDDNASTIGYAIASPLATRDDEFEDGENDSDQENDAPPHCKSRAANRPFRSLDTEGVRECVLQPLSLPKGDEEKGEDVDVDESYFSPVRIKSPPPVHRVISVSSKKRESAPLSHSCSSASKKPFSYKDVHRRTSSPLVRQASKMCKLRRRTASPAAFKDLVRGLYEDDSDGEKDNDDENGGNTVDVKAALRLLEDDGDENDDAKSTADRNASKNSDRGSDELSSWSISSGTSSSLEEKSPFRSGSANKERRKLRSRKSLMPVSGANGSFFLSPSSSDCSGSTPLQKLF